ncbi:MAG: AAA family ATPase [Phocaeicola sp.]
MKLLKLTLLNLASLEGEQIIDFQVEPLKSSHLFSITGATGSGKSTILDAICLALYGSCPRFMGASKVKFYGESDFHNDKDLQPHDVRNILSRGTKQCFAELLFLANDDLTYRVRWSCEVGRTNYQKAIRKLYRLECNKEGIAVEKELELGAKRGDNDTIDQLIGLNYQQFVRTVMLAQGSFANFIKADDKEKAILLEKLTGTEIYTVIAQKIYEFYKVAADTYLDLEREVNQIAAHLLTEEESLAVSEERSRLDRCWSEALAGQKRIERSVQWWDSLDELKTHVASYEKQVEGANHSLSLLNHDEKELELWDEVTPIQATYMQLQPLEVRLRKIQCDISEVVNSKAICEKELGELFSQLSEARESYALLKKEVELKSPLISKAKVTKATLDELQSAISARLDKLQQISIAQKNAEIAVEESQKRADNERKKELDAITTLEELKPHEQMIEEIKVIGSELKDMHLKEEKYRVEFGNIEKAKQQWVVEKGAWNSEQLAYLKLQEEMVTAAQQLNLSKEQLNLLGVDELQKELSQATIRANDLERVVQLSKELITNIELYETKKGEVTTIQQEIQRYETELLQLKEERESIDKVLPGLEQAYQLTIGENTEAMRALLKPELPCPICGSTLHPYAEQNVIELLSPVRLEIERYTMRLKEIEEEVNHPQKGWNTLLHQSCGKVQGLKELLKQIQKGCVSSYQEQIKIEEKYPDLVALVSSTVQMSFEEIEGENVGDISLPSSLKMRELDGLLIASKEQIKRASQAMNDYTQLQKTIEKKQHSYDVKKESSEKILQNLNEQHALLCAEESRIEEQQKSVEDLNSLLLLKRNMLRSQITLSDWEMLYENHFEELLDKLRSLYKESTAAKEQKESAQTILKELAAKIVEQQKMVKSQQEAEEKEKEELARYKKREELEQENYRHLLGGMDPFELEKSLNIKAEQADEKERLYTQIHKEKGEVLSRLNGTYEALLVQQTAEQIKQKELSEKINHFVSSYNEGMCGKELLTLERLQKLFDADKEWADKRKRLEEAKGEVKRLAGILQKCKDDLVKHHTLGDKPEEERVVLQERLKELIVQQEQIDKERQLASGKWMAHQEALRKVAHYQEDLCEKKKEYENWKLLNDILGNKDGDNFRETAQIYTLQFLLKQANAQLTLLTHRYRLEQVANSLGIRIVDRDRADEVRNLSSLSGGETFLVSLSLALGLSSLSSRNISIQNLFVDEGFGTLDSDSLNMVIDALSSLHTMQGKKVGVISHTSEMKERIHTQIKVVKQGTGGRSVLEIG